MAAISVTEAIILGIVEGVTEFIPVSSTGHLILTSHLLGLKGDAVSTFEIFIQLGAILAVVVLYWRRFVGLFQISSSQLNEVGRIDSFQGWHGILRIACASLPIFVLGWCFGPTIKQQLFNPFSVAFALIVGALLMMLAEYKCCASKVATLEQVALKHAMLIGLFQTLALWPGMSRSGATIIGAMLFGLDRRVAAEFSFLVAVPVMLVATMSDLLGNADAIHASHIGPFAVGFGVSFLVALIAVRTFIAALGKMTLIPFAIYRLAVGIIVLSVL